LGGGRRALGGSRETVPPPQVAGAADEALARLQGRLQLMALGAVGDDAGLAQAAIELRRCLHVSGKLIDARGQHRIVAGHLDMAPMDGCFLLGRRLEIVAESRAERCLVAVRHAQALEDRREIRHLTI
jgi:hypothetical protein